MLFYMGLGILMCIWAVLGMYVFSEIKKTYDRGAVFTRKLLAIWFVMWGFHHLPVILSSLYAIWMIPINKRLALAGGLFMIGAGTTIVVAGMIEFRSLRRSCGQDTSKLVTTGIYRYSRNPQFVGWFLVLLGISLIGRSGLAFVLTGVFAIVIHLYTTEMEEPYLERLYGEEYRLYKLRSARYIGIPKEGKKEHMTNLISIIVSVSILILTIIFKNQFDSGVFLQIIGLFIGITGLIFWITGRATLGKYFTISHKPKGLITNGIYAKIRHPMYSGGILLYLGLGLFFKSIIGIVLTIILLAPLLIYSAIIEERLLIKKYGKSYIEYKKKTIF